MNNLTTGAFSKMIGALLVREDNEGFRRVWGHLADEEQRTVTFWLHKPGDDYQFKILETYVIASSVTELEDQKEAKGYSRVSPDSAEGRRLLHLIRASYLRRVEEGSFHFSPRA